MQSQPWLAYAAALYAENGAKDNLPYPNSTAPIGWVRQSFWYEILKHAIALSPEEAITLAPVHHAIFENMGVHIPEHDSATLEKSFSGQPVKTLYNWKEHIPDGVNMLKMPFGPVERVAMGLLYDAWSAYHAWVVETGQQHFLCDIAEDQCIVATAADGKTITVYLIDDEPVFGDVNGRAWASEAEAREILGEEVAGFRARYPDDAEAVNVIGA